MDHAGHTEATLDKRVPDVHGLRLQTPGALGHAEEDEMHEEDTDDRRDEAQTDLREDDPSADEQMAAEDVEQALGRGFHLLGVGL
jgi:hypothetical protein